MVTLCIDANSNGVGSQREAGNQLSERPELAMWGELRLTCLAHRHWVCNHSFVRTVLLGKQATQCQKKPYQLPSIEDINVNSPGTQDSGGKNKGKQAGKVTPNEIEIN